jgi:hypothetical protein
MKLKTNIIMAALALASLTGISQAAVILSGSGNNSGFTVSSSDLLQTQLLSKTSTITINGAENSQWSGDATVDNLTDGLFPTSPNSSTGSLAITGGDVTYTLDTSVNTLGYDLTSIGIFSGWNDDGRDGINVSVSYATVAAPLTYVPLTTATQDDGASKFENANITESVTPFVLASGVKSIRFAFNAQENGAVGYKELDVIGAATIPEPSAALLGGLGLLALLRRRR